MKCEAFMGNVMDGKTCHACGLNGPAGQGWQVKAMADAERIIALEADLACYQAEAGDIDAHTIREWARSIQADAETWSQGQPADHPGHDDAGEEWRLARTVIALADAYEAKCWEVVRLRVHLAKAQGLRLVGVPLAGNVAVHGGRPWLIEFYGQLGIETRQLRIAADGVVEMRTPHHKTWTALSECKPIVSAIPLDHNGQPCPVGGWGGDG